MRLTPILALCAALMAAIPFAAPAALADALPMPVELNAEQKLLIGVWQEQNAVMPEGLGHSFTLRTLAFGNDQLTMMTFGGISYSNEYGSSAMVGTWTAKRIDEKTLLVTLDQGGGRGTELTLVFDGAGSFTMQDKERSMLPASAFRRATPPPADNPAP